MTTMEELINILGAEEPEYDLPALNDASIIPLLATLIGGADSRLAARAVGVAAKIGDDEAVALVREAAASSDSLLRIAAAAAVENLPSDAASEILATLVRDDDAGVRYVALGSVPDDPTPDLVASIESLGEDEPESDVRERAEGILEGIA